MNELALFAGAGGGILGGQLLGWRTICAIEIDPYCRNVLLARQRDGCLPRFPIWDDIRTFEGKSWCGSVDVVTGGFPCQDISVAGKGIGIEGKRSGLWAEMARVISEVRSGFVFVENSSMLVGRGLAVVLGDLAKMGYDASWCVLGADALGAPHLRERVWILAIQGEISDTIKRYLREQRQRGRQQYEFEKTAFIGNDGEKKYVADAYHQRWKRSGEYRYIKKSNQGGSCSVFGAGCWWESEPSVGRVVNGLAHRVVQLRAIGNGQVPAVAASAWSILMEGYFHDNGR